MVYKGKEFHPGQGNNAYIFPGIGLAIICVGMRSVPEEVFIKSAEALANLVTQEDLDKGGLYPPLENIVECSVKIAVDVANYAYELGKVK